MEQTTTQSASKISGLHSKLRLVCNTFQGNLILTTQFTGCYTKIKKLLERYDAKENTPSLIKDTEDLFSSIKNNKQLKRNETLQRIIAIKVS